MAEIRCFLLEPTDRTRRWLRRYRSGSDGGANICPLMPGAHSYHDARSPIEDAPVVLDSEGLERSASWEDFKNDPRWPTHCACGEPFSPSTTGADARDLFTLRIWRRADTGEELTLDEAPPGAMWRAYRLEPQMAGPDGRCYTLKTPGGEWLIDGPSINGNGWTRTGEAPNFTATPSIGIFNADGSFRYHGWLRDGKLVDA